MNWVAPTAPIVSGGISLKPPCSARTSTWEIPAKDRPGEPMPGLAGPNGPFGPSTNMPPS